MSVFTIQPAISHRCNKLLQLKRGKEKKQTPSTKMFTLNHEEKEVIDFDPRLQGPFTCLVAGPTGCGKTQLIFKLMDNADQLITVHDIVYCYGQWQNKFKQFGNKSPFTKGSSQENNYFLSPHKSLVLSTLYL